MGEHDDKNALFWGRQRIGDVVMSIPALKLIRKHAPALNVRYATTFYSRELVELTGLVDDVRCYRSKGGIWNFLRWLKIRREVTRGEYQHIFLTGKVSRYRRKIADPSDLITIDDVPEGHTAEKCARVVMEELELGQVSVPSPAIDLSDDPDVRGRLERLGLSYDEPSLLVHPACNRIIRGHTDEGANEKLWPSSKYIPLFERLRDNYHNLQIVLVGTEEERPWIKRQITDRVSRSVKPLNFAGCTSIHDTLQLLRHSNALLCGDSGVMHLATMTQTPMVTLFGPTNENQTGPFGVGTEVVKLRAVPYSRAVDDPESMDKIRVDTVYDALISRLDKYPAL